MPPRKRKSGVADVVETPAKRTRRSTADPATPKTAAALTTSTPTAGEKRSRGRPRKLSDSPATAPVSAKRGPGRPRATPLPLVEQAATTKRGPGRPRKDGEIAKASSPKPVAQTSGRGRGRPKENPAELNGVALPNGSAARGKRAVKASEADIEQSDDEETDRPSYWLMKAEPESRIEKGVDVKFSIDDLREATEPEPWDGVRNFVALKHMQLMKKGDLAFFYHSNCKTPGVAGIMEIVREHSIDESAFNPNHPYYDEKQRYTRENHKWEVVHVEFRRKFNQIVPLNVLKAHAQPGGPLQDLQTLKQSRLSVSAVAPSEWDFIVQLAGEDGDKSTEAATTEESEPAEESNPD